MASSDSRDGGNGEQRLARRLPSFEDYRRIKYGVGLTDHARRIFWTLNGPLTTAISVMEHPYYDPDSVLEPYFRQTPADSAPSWHPVSRESFFTPPVSSITLPVWPLEMWEDDWYELHYPHAEPLSDFIGCEGIRVGPLPDYDPDQDEEPEGENEPVHLLGCCETERPRNKKVKVVVEAEGEFLTVHDILSTLHPRLLGACEDIREALGGLLDGKSISAETKLMVYPPLGDAMVVDEHNWFHNSGKPREDLIRLEPGPYWYLVENEAGELVLPPGTFPPGMVIPLGMFPPGTQLPPGMEPTPESSGTADGPS